jgi:hypothetical protein
MISTHQLQTSLQSDLNAHDTFDQLVAAPSARGQTGTSGVVEAGLKVYRYDMVDEKVNMVNRSVWATQVMLPHTGAKIGVFDLDNAWSEATMHFPGNSGNPSVALQSNSITWKLGHDLSTPGKVSTCTDSGAGASAGSTCNGNDGSCAWDCSSADSTGSACTISNATCWSSSAARVAADELLVAKPVCTSSEYMSSDQFINSRRSNDYLNRPDREYAVGDGECGAGTEVPALYRQFVTSLIPMADRWGLRKGSRCYPGMLGDGKCDRECYSAECDFDFGDCSIEKGSAEVYEIVLMRKFSGVPECGEINGIAQARLKASVLAPYIHDMKHQALIDYLYLKDAERKAGTPNS